MLPSARKRENGITYSSSKRSVNGQPAKCRKQMHLDRPTGFPTENI